MIAIELMAISCFGSAYLPAPPVATHDQDHVGISLGRTVGIGGSDCRLEAGETLFRGGDVVRRLYRVVDGQILLVRPLPHGADLIIQRARAGDIVAEASLFAETYHCDAVARGIACVRGVPVGRVNDLIERRPDLARALASLYAAEVQRARTKAEIASLKTVAMRLDAWLSLHHGGLPGKGRWHEIAAEIAVSPAALYRELAARRAIDK